VALVKQREMDAGLAAAFAAAGVVPDEAGRIAGLTLLSAPRLKAIMLAAAAVKTLPGHSAEVGCAAGGTSRLMALLAGDRTHWVCDTFDGLVDVQAVDAPLTNRMFHNVEAEVAARLDDLDNVRIVAGYFPGSAPMAMRMHRFRLVHVDVDTYRSIHEAFAFFSARMVSGGIMAIDDAIGRGTPGGKLAWQEILGARSGWRVIGENDPQVVICFD
jgi:hypothetical protein